jgi:hypothetical protein
MMEWETLTPAHQPLAELRELSKESVFGDAMVIIHQQGC